MSVRCQVIIDAIEKIAPKYLAENWDNVGLIIGSPAQTVEKVLVSLDVTDEVVKRAVEEKVDLIISHHPVIFQGINNIRTDLPHGRLLAELIKADIAVYAAHTNLDTAVGGVNDVLAELLGLSETEPLSVTYTGKLYKLTVFVPEDHADKVRQAITEAGAGHIGNYKCCTFQTAGVGTFLPLEGTNPYIGEQGKLERVQEVRLETIVPERLSNRVIRAMLKVHPYEEVAYDIYPLNNAGRTFGLGRVGKLSHPRNLDEFVAELKGKLKLDKVRVVGEPDKSVQKVAICGGSGAGLLAKAAFAGADVLVTGDVKYHEAQDALAKGIALVDAGHYATEIPIVQVLTDYLNDCSVKQKWHIAVVGGVNAQDIFRFY